MTIDITKITPAPWETSAGATPTDPYDEKYDWYFARGPFIKGKPYEDGIAQAKIDAEFIALARNAFDVMMRRFWQPEKTQKGWRLSGNVVCFYNNEAFLKWWSERGDYDDPFTPLVEADAWYRENVDAKE